MNDLIERLEAATGPCRELDAAIALEVDGGEIVWKMANYTMESYPARRYASADHVSGYGNAPVPLYTTSIDSALTLVPEGWAEYTLMNGNGYHEATFNNHEAKRTVWGSSYASPALAICLAALKAHKESIP